MRPTALLRATEAWHRTPMIQFLGKRDHLEKGSHAPRPHPTAPPEIVENFQSFLSKLQSASGTPDSPSSNPKGQSLESSSRGEVKPGGSGTGGGVKDGGKSSGSSSGSGSDSLAGSSGKEGKGYDFENWLDAPRRLTKPKIWDELELESVMSGGASNTL